MGLVGIGRVVGLLVVGMESGLLVCLGAEVHIHSLVGRLYPRGERLGESTVRALPDAGETSILPRPFPGKRDLLVDI